ncbi:hypothetical protein K458DRAFT_486431 [Lentithecium fluviatile CBS 122367]|uniref:Mediator of RNA polymerase II transcription subunit 11 n=1 Tax=Lentithecium fluviatile CBS 122367 TaxID=1168545 RepID=A0A6G1J5N7_9PLEO|nr:hypothetical protein K458DRAFT_486431 [Lentithecium fluviatile CBS 122367]
MVTGGLLFYGCSRALSPRGGMGTGRVAHGERVEFRASGSVRGAAAVGEVACEWGRRNIPPRTQPTMATPPTPPYSDTSSAHIRALSALAQRIPTLLTTSATTFSQLTNAPIRPPSMELSPTAPDTPALRRAALQTTANAFFTTVLELRSALHAQIDDLEKHKVIPADEVKYTAPATAAGAGQSGQQEEEKMPPPKDSEASVKNGGLGSFDVGVLNARAGVRQREGNDVLERVKSLLEDLVQETEAEVKEEEMEDA